LPPVLCHLLVCLPLTFLETRSPAPQLVKTLLCVD
jgi:hypothetical protein